jgi:hypothetical protein
MTLSSLPSNVVNSTGGPVEGAGEAVFLERLFTAVRERMGGDFERFTFVVHRRRHGELPGRPIQLDPGGPDRVLLLLADECEVFPVSEFRSYRAIFRAYGFPCGGASGIHGLPVSYQNAAGLAEPVPFENRGVSVFFSGCLNSSRVDLYRQFAPLPLLPKRNLPLRHLRELVRRGIARAGGPREFDTTFPGGIIRFTEAFGTGMASQWRMVS